MSKTSLELYQQAFDLHYNQQRIQDACSLYKDIIRQFPDSNESAYAALQLEKIGAEQVVGTLGGNSGVSIWVILLLAGNLLALAAIGGWHYVTLKELKQQIRNTAVTVRKLDFTVQEITDKEFARPRNDATAAGDVPAAADDAGDERE
ncbi:MAG: hypothetical protein GF398_12610 [Chitinivibrionales bacterium]|nr:hypothetical protein [Chitinivibrionales bacterium]